METNFNNFLNENRKPIPGDYFESPTDFKGKKLYDIALKSWQKKENSKKENIDDLLDEIIELSNIEKLYTERQMKNNLNKINKIIKEFKKK
jgi:hypothetical protein